MGKILHEELSGTIIGIAMEILNELKPGLDESLYERAMAIELRRRGHVVEAQQSFPVFYRGELIGTLVPDLIVDSSIIADPKVVSAFSETHIAQMIGYLNITGLELALRLNFKTLVWIGNVSFDSDRLPMTMSLIYRDVNPPNYADITNRAKTAIGFFIRAIGVIRG